MYSNSLNIALEERVGLNSNSQDHFTVQLCSKNEWTLVPSIVSYNQ